jgi:hypothetical protein
MAEIEPIGKRRKAKTEPPRHAASTASADSFFACRLQILWVGLRPDNDATGNPFRRRGVPMTAASIPGVAGKMEG